jgi:hypothetical protein
MPWLLFTLGKDPVPIVQEVGWAPGPVWTGAGNLAPTGIQSPDRPARSQSLYRLRYLAHIIPLCTPNIKHKQKYHHREPIILESATRNNLEVYTPIVILMIYFSWGTVRIQSQ